MKWPQKAPQSLSEVPPVSPGLAADLRRQKSKERRQRRKQRTARVEVHTYYLQELRREMNRHPQLTHLQQLTESDLIRAAVIAYRRELKFKRDLEAYLESDLAS